MNERMNEFVQERKVWLLPWGLPEGSEGPTPSGAGPEPGLRVPLPLSPTLRGNGV